MVTATHMGWLSSSGRNPQTLTSMALVPGSEARPAKKKGCSVKLYNFQHWPSSVENLRRRRVIFKNTTFHSHCYNSFGESTWWSWLVLYVVPQQPQWGPQSPGCCRDGGPSGSPSSCNPRLMTQTHLGTAMTTENPLQSLEKKRSIMNWSSRFIWMQMQFLVVRSYHVQWQGQQRLAQTEPA